MEATTTTPPLFLAHPHGHLLPRCIFFIMLTTPLPPPAATMEAIPREATVVDGGLRFMVCNEREPRRIPFSFFVFDTDGSWWFAMTKGTVAMNGSRLEHGDEASRPSLPSPLHFPFLVLFSVVNHGDF
ncbi:unnamed protein product [Lupinus luteus]|uniref:Uncharacterized protein n=1 Tax=Lupinus luteus TaxID=3873 RepID=A0AAV1WUI7_LUPLU